MCEEISEIYDYTVVITWDQLLHTTSPPMDISSVFEYHSKRTAKVKIARRKNVKALVLF